MDPTIRMRLRVEWSLSAFQQPAPAISSSCPPALATHRCPACWHTPQPPSPSREAVFSMSPVRGWSLAAALLLAVGIQLIRDRRGAFDLVAFAAVAAGLVLLAMVAVRFSLLLIPVTSLLTVAVVSALLRETAESRSARRESGRLLNAVLEHVGATPSTVPRTAAGRLDALRRLQDRVLEEDATRRALLADMDEGVILWDRQGKILLANPAAERLWGGAARIHRDHADRGDCGSYRAEPRRARARGWRDPTSIEAISRSFATSPPSAPSKSAARRCRGSSRTS